MYTLQKLAKIGIYLTPSICTEHSFLKVKHLQISCSSTIIEYRYNGILNVFNFVSKAPKFKNLFFFVFFEGALLKSSCLSSFQHIFVQNGWFTCKIYQGDFLFGKFILFLDFFSGYFPDFSALDFFTEWMVYISHIDMMIFFSGNI